MFRNAVQQLANQIKKSKSQLVVLGETHIHTEHRYFTSALLGELKKQGFNMLFDEMDYHTQPCLPSVCALPIHSTSYQYGFSDIETENQYAQAFSDLSPKANKDKTALFKQIFEYEQLEDYNFLAWMTLPVSAHQMLKTAEKQGYKTHFVDCDTDAYGVDKKQQQVALKNNLGLDLSSTIGNNSANGIILRNHFMSERVSSHLSKGDKGVLLVGNNHTKDTLTNGIVVPSIKHELASKYNIPTFSCSLGNYYDNLESTLKEVNLLNKFTRNLQKIHDLHYINAVSVVKPEISDNALPDSHVIFPDQLFSEINKKYTGEITQAFTENKTQFQIDAWNALCKKDRNETLLIR